MMARLRKLYSRGNRAHWWRSVRMRDVIIFTALPLFVGLILIAGSVLNYEEVHQFDDAWSRQAHIRRFFGERIRAALGLPSTMALRRRLDPEVADAGVVRLWVKGEMWRLWQGDPLALWGHWVDASLVRGNTLDRVKLRKRGDTSVHWTTEKKSFTLKTSRSSLFKGYRRLAFSAKEVLPQYLTNRLATEFDLLAPFTTVTPVFVNKRFYGVYRVTEIVDESFLRLHGRMPGNIFRGDTAERGEYFKGVPRGLFNNPYIWDRVAVNDRPAAGSGFALQRFLRDLSGTTFDDHLRFMDWLDRQEIAHLVALMLLVGDPYHMSNVHNQFWYEDPSTGLLHPIPWDLRLLTLEQGGEPPRLLNKFLRTVLRNPFVLDDAMRLLHERLARGHLLETAEQQVKAVYEQYRDHFLYDGLRKGSIPDVGSPDEVLSVLRTNVRLLREWMDDSVIAFHAETQTSHPIILDFEARGRVGSDLHSIEVDGDLETGQSIRLVADRNRNGLLDISDPELSGQWTVTSSGGRLTLGTASALLPGFDAEKPGINPAPIHYRFFITSSAGTTGRISAVRANLRNRLTGEPANLIEWKPGVPVSSTPSWHPWMYSSPRPVVHRLAGNVHLRKTLIIRKADTLVVEAGTRMQMDPDVSILVRGRMVAIGKPDQPITFHPAVQGRPWGTIALQGDGATGSAFEHVRFSGGGGAILDRVEYKGMVSVHWAKNVKFQHCEFADNVRSDDALNAVHSNVQIHDCRFLRTNADAIDFDYSSGEITDSRFEDSGNDAIDLMASAANIVGNHITRSGDKGISIGEASHPFVFNNYIARSRRGVEIKDRSEPFLVNNVISHNTIGILQSVKNWRYGAGGWVKLVNSVVVGNETDLRSDSGSRLTRVGSVVGPDVYRAAPENPTDAGDIAWIFAHYGIHTESKDAGLINGWRSARTTLPKISATFEDNFGQVADGWVPAGGITRLEKRNRNLVAVFRRRRGQISRLVDWDLTDPGYRYIAVFELSGSNLKPSRISLHSDDREVARPIAPPEDLASSSFVTMELDPAHYRAIRIEATPGPGIGQLELRSYRLYAIPRSNLPKRDERPLAGRVSSSGQLGER